MERATTDPGAPVDMTGSLSTERLRLESFRLADAAELHEIFSDPASYTIGDGPYDLLEKTEAWIRRRIDTRQNLGLCWYAARLRSTGRMVGNCGLFAGRTGPNEPEIGYLMRADSRGHGYATEAAAAVIAECDRAGLSRVWATVRPANEASLRILRTIGMTPDHEEQDAKGRLLYLTRMAPSSR